MWESHPAAPTVIVVVITSNVRPFRLKNCSCVTLGCDHHLTPMAFLQVRAGRGARLYASNFLTDCFPLFMVFDDILIGILVRIL